MKMTFTRPLKLLLIIALTIFITEGSIMYLLYRYLHFSPQGEGLIDAFLLIIVIFPVLYLFFLKPMEREIAQRQSAEKALRKAKDGLELRVAERTVELREANRALKKSEQKYRGLFNDALDMIHIVDADGRIVDANKIELETMGYTKEEYLGKPLLEIVHPDCRNITKKVFEQVMRGKDVRSYETALITKKGEKIAVEVSAVPQIERGKVVLARGIIRDITERKRAAEALKRSEEKYRKLAEKLTNANSMKDLLLDVITHDLKNPAGVISGIADVTIKEHPNKEEIQMVKESSDSLLKTIDNAITLAEVTFGENLKTQMLDIKEIIEKVIREFKWGLESAGMILENNLTHPLLVRANPIIAEVFRNYISNAIKYASSGKRIVIHAEQKKDYIVIGISDFGESIRAENYERIFLRRAQLEPGVSHGRGLGLAIVRRIAEAHGGTVWVEANKPKGNIFYLKMPRGEIDVNQHNL
jgi:PAS domain S-box-containing protein